MGELAALFARRHCARSRLFVDDLDHPDLRATLGTHYIRVQPYEYHPPFNLLLDTYDAALQSVGEPSLTTQDRQRLIEKTEPHTTASQPADPGFPQQMDQAIREVIDSRAGGRKRVYRLQSARSVSQHRQKKRRHRTKKRRQNRE